LPGEFETVKENKVVITGIGPSSRITVTEHGIPGLPLDQIGGGLQFKKDVGACGPFESQPLDHLIMVQVPVQSERIEAQLVPKEATHTSRN
jgi:hypothetical protein